MPRSEVYNMDCMELMRRTPDKAFQLAIADPPYGLRDAGGATGGAGKLRGRAFNNGMIDRWDKAPSEEFFSELRRVSEHQIIWGGNYFPLPPTRCFVCWDKCQPWPNFSQVEYAWTSFTKPAKLFQYDNRTGDKIHPTQKPVALYAYLLATFAPVGGGNLRPDDGLAVEPYCCLQDGLRLRGLRDRRRLLRQRSAVVRRGMSRHYQNQRRAHHRATLALRLKRKFRNDNIYKKGKEYGTETTLPRHDG